MALGEKRGRFVEEAADRSFYVYELVDPRDQTVFYVGKGKGQRLRQHVAAVRNYREANAEKSLRIGAIIAAGQRVIERKVFQSLSEPEAFRLEREKIAEHGLRNLTNVARGELTARERSKIQAKALLVRLKPRDEWLAERVRSDLQIRIADAVRSDLQQIAIYGQVSEIIAGPNGLEFR